MKSSKLGIMRFGLLAFFMLLPSFVYANSEIIIKSSVSPEFPNGLHAKYLQYIATKADLKLDIYPMPFARRITSLKNGEINLMVGLKSSFKEEQFQFLHPSYERTGGIYFIRYDSPYLQSTEAELGRVVAAFSINRPEMLKWANDNFKRVVTVSSLTQKILMLEKGRIDTFVHYESSAKYKIRELGLEDVVVPAKYQSPRQQYPYHFAINPESQLYTLKDKLERVISEGVAQGDFARLRYDHEAALEAKKN